MSNPGSAAKGQACSVYLVARSRGTRYNSANTQYVPAPIVQNFNITPKLAVEAIGEFGTPNDILTVATYSNVEVSFKIYETDLIYLYAILMDVDPASANVTWWPELLFKSWFTAFANQVSQAPPGNIMNGWVVSQIQLSDATETQDVKGNKMIDFKGTGLLYRKVMNGAVDYTRGNFASVSFPTGYGKTFSATGVVTTNYTPVAQPLPGTNSGTSSQSYLLVLQNGASVTTGFSQSGTSFIVAAGTTGATDWWDIFVPVAPHVPYSSNYD